LVFLVAGQYRSVHRIESEPYIDDTPLWPEKDGDHFPHRIKLSPPLLVGEVSAAQPAEQISFMRGKIWGGTIQGASGVFNPHLTEADLRLIEGRMPQVAETIHRPQATQARAISDRQLALFKFYEAEIEERIAGSLDPLRLWIYRDPSSGRDGRQYQIDKGRIDLLCEEPNTGDLVVLELKKGEAPQETLLQILRYMSWVRQNLAGNRNVRGVILTESADSVLSSVVFDVPNVEIRYY
jgi:hypothetical protein